MGQHQAKPSRAELDSPSSSGATVATRSAQTSSSACTSSTAILPVASVSQSRMDFSPTTAHTGFSIARSFSKRGRGRHAAIASIGPTTPAVEYKFDMLRQLQASEAGAAGKLVANADLPPKVRAARSITPTRRIQRMPITSSSRSSSIKSSKRAEREWRARLAALSSGPAMPRNSNELVALGGPVPPRRQIGRPWAATHAKLASTRTPHPSMDFKRELVKATSYDTLGANGLLSSDAKRHSRRLSASTSKTFASLASNTSIIAPSTRFSQHIPTTPHHLTIPPLTPDATPMPSPQTRKDATPLPSSSSQSSSNSASHSPIPSPVSAKFDISLQTPPQLRPLSELSGLGFTFPRNTSSPSDLLALHDEDGEPVLASRKRETMVGSRRSFPRLEDAVAPGSERAPHSAGRDRRQALPKLRVASDTSAKSSFSLNFLSLSHSLSSPKTLGYSPESPTSAFILSAPSIGQYAWGLDLDILEKEQPGSPQTPTKTQRSRRGHPFAAATMTDLRDEGDEFDMSPSSLSAAQAQIPSPLGSSPPSAIAYGRHEEQDSIIAYRAEPSSPSPKPRGQNEMRRGGLDLTPESVRGAVMQPVDSNTRGRGQTKQDTPDKIPARKAFELTPGADGGRRPAKSGLPRRVSFAAVADELDADDAGH